jgi:hypothetical protein
VPGVREYETVKRPKRVASGLVTVLVLLGTFSLFAGLVLFGSMEVRGNGPPRASVTQLAGAVVLLTAGVALIGFAIALDRRDCRKADEEAMPGFEVVVRPRDKPAP